MRWKIQRETSARSGGSRYGGSDSPTATELRATQGLTRNVYAGEPAMNRSLFYSKFHVPLAAATVVPFVAWLYTLDASVGAREESDRVFVLWSGWASFALMIICLLYVPRKYFYKIRARLGTWRDSLAGTREGRWLLASIGFLTLRRARAARRRQSANVERRVVLAGTTFETGAVERTRQLRDKYLRLEEAEGQLARVRAEIARGFLTSRGEVRKRIREILKNYGVDELVRLDLRSGDPDQKEPAFVFALSPREPLRRMSHWLHSHFFYGVAFAVLVGLHGGGSLTSPMGILLNGLSLIVAVSGLLGIVLCASGPARLARAERECGVGYEQSLALKAHVETKIAEIEAENRLLEGARKFLETPQREAVCQAWLEVSREAVTRNLVSKKEKNDVAKDLAMHTRVVSLSSGVLAVEVDHAAVLADVPATTFQAMVEKMRKAELLRTIRTIRFCESISKRVPDDPATEHRARDLEILRTRYQRYDRRSRRLGRLRFWMNLWRGVHIPASVLLTALVILHALSIWWY